MAKTTALPVWKSGCVGRGEENSDVYFPGKKGHYRQFSTVWNNPLEIFRSKTFRTDFFNDLIKIASFIENEFCRSLYHPGNFSYKYSEPISEPISESMALVFFRSLERMKGGRNESPRARGSERFTSSKSLFCRSLPRAPWSSNLLHFFIFCREWQRLFWRRGGLVPRTRKQKSIPPFTLLLFCSYL